MNVCLSSFASLAQQRLGRAVTKGAVTNVGTTTPMSRASLTFGIISSLAGSAASTTTTTTRTLCAPSSDKDNDDNVLNKLVKTVTGGTTSKSLNATLDELALSLGNQLQGALDSGIPTQLSYGFVSGYCSGLALKKYRLSQR